MDLENVRSAEFKCLRHTKLLSYHLDTSSVKILVARYFHYAVSVNHNQIFARNTYFKVHNIDNNNLPDYYVISLQQRHIVLSTFISNRTDGYLIKYRGATKIRKKICTYFEY